MPSQALLPARLPQCCQQHPFLEGPGTGRWQTRALPPCFLAPSPHGSRNRSDINGSPINNPKARGRELVPAQHWPQPTQSQGLGCLLCALGISNASCSLPTTGFPGSCPLGQCHGRSSNASAEPQPWARSGAEPGIPGGHPMPIELLPSSQHWAMPITGTLLQPSQQILGHSSSSDQEPQQGLGRDTPVFTTVLTADQVIPWLHPNISQLHPPSTSPITAMSSAAPISMPSMGTQPPPCQGYHHATTAPLHPGDCGNALGTPKSREEATSLVTSPALPDFAWRHSLTSQPCRGTQ